jgi:predicted  nucleic acid-binding Zn-ribbon protein
MSVELGYMRVVNATQYSLYIMYNVFTKETSYCKRVIGQSYDEQKTFLTNYIYNLHDYFLEIDTNDEHLIMMKSKKKIVNHFQLIDTQNKVVEVIVSSVPVPNNIGAQCFTTFDVLHRYITFTFASKYKNDLHTTMQQSICNSISMNIVEEKINSLLKGVVEKQRTIETKYESIISWSDTFDETKEEVEECKGLISNQQKRIDEYVNVSEKHNNDIESIKHNITSKFLNINELIKGLNDSIFNIEKLLMNSVNDIRDLTSDIRKLQGDKCDLAYKIDDLRYQVGKHKETINSISNKVLDIQNDVMSVKLE